MDKLNDVFLAVRDYYNNHYYIKEQTSFENIASVANVDIKELDYYLFLLKKLGLIKYSMMDDKYLFLTSYGAKTTTLLTQEFQDKKATMK